MSRIDELNGDVLVGLATGLHGELLEREVHEASKPGVCRHPGSIRRHQAGLAG